ncbi:MAG: hypothetical protein KatS3mg129_2198 [Leptospiraceae bacterium]|nr:MAG: hypothetical protein KatS3mg129_2198 [Leptospiraceae bacterium]
MLNVNIKKTILFSDYKAEFFLLFATILWGSTFPVIHYGLQWIHPFMLIFLRFFIAFIVLSILILVNIISINYNIFTWNTFKKSLFLGLIGFVSYYTQTYGLLYTTPHRSAFITQLLIVFVYLFQYLFLKKTITIKQWFSLLLDSFWFLYIIFWISFRKSYYQ